MHRRTPIAALLIMTLAAAGASPADEPPDLSLEELARRGTEASAVVDFTKSSKRLATAFCVHPSGLFVTFAEPFLPPRAPFTSVPLVIRPGRADQSILEAKVVRRLKDPGLTLLRVDGASGLVALPLGPAESIEELIDVAAFDVPASKGKDQSASKAFPKIHFAPGSVSATQRKEGQLERVQFDAPLSPGSAGGPLLDRKGRVLGVILGRAKADFGAGVDLAIPVNRLEWFLKEVELEPTLPVVRAADPRPVEFAALAKAYFPSDDPLNVELVLGGGVAGDERHFPMSLAEGAYRARAVPAANPPSPPMVRLEATFDDGTASGLVEDRTIRIGAAPGVRLGEVRRLQLRPKVVAWLGNGSTLEGGAVAGLGRATMDLGGKPVPVDLGRARTIIIAPPSTFPAIKCSVVASRAGREVGRKDSLMYPEDRVSACLEAVRAGLFIRPSRSEAPVSYLSFESEAPKASDPRPSVALRGGEFRAILSGRGNYAQVDLATRTVEQVRRENRRRGVVVESAEEGKPGRWAFRFEAPGARDLIPGDYPKARKMDIKGELPEFSFVPGKEEGYEWSRNQDTGGSCRFVVWEFEVKDDQVTRLAIDFLGRCEWAIDTMTVDFRPFHGMIRYNSTFR